MRFLQSFWAGLFSLFLIFSMSSVSATNISECYSTSMEDYQSRLVMDAQGACWFEDAGDGETAFSLARDLSHDKVIIVITALSPPESAERVARFGQKLSDWLEQREEILHQVPVVVRSDAPGVAFKVYVDGIPLIDEEHELGLFNVNDIQTFLPRVVKFFKAALIIRYKETNKETR